ncbi:putative bifunctional diguanylate cyclase/phosphodiesterase [Alicyclobacillus acidiphilus]|uniref:putative bifunctional diguanylate cyclase/phosphodiesterase n=1 Tax=Alicyclobacillus acidiphilus TaxID=182455 RepID=UPI00082BDCCA|nr:GGDEF domain-containing phosphodiesterase [Alicyclobacillus acidiphilus]
MAENDVQVNPSSVVDVGSNRAESSAGVPVTAFLPSFHQIFHAVLDAVYIYPLGSDGEPRPFVTANEAAERFLGYSAKEIQRLLIWDIVHPSLHDTLREIYQTLRPGQRVLTESVYVTKSGEAFPVEVSLQSVEIRSHRLIVSICRDISQRKASEQQLFARSFFDYGTGFPNEAWLRNQLSRLEAQGQPVSIIAIGLNKFVPLRDTYGDAVTNEVVQILLMRLQRVLPRACIGRVAFNEFVMILQSSYVDRGLLGFLASRIEQPIHVSGFTFHLQASFGVALHSSGRAGDGRDAQLFSHALLALHSAESEGLHYQFYSPHLHRRIDETHQTYLRLVDALDRGEITVRYQPELDARGKVVGAEALARWEVGDVPVEPGTFISVAEEVGLIHKLGIRVLATVCRDLAHNPVLRDSGISISVNCSVRQLDNPDFLRQVRTVMDNYGIPPTRIVFEVTESAFADSGKHLSILKAVQQEGIRLAIDDFGTGYSSLQYFRDLTPDILKIDQSFIRGIGEERNAEIIVAGIIDLAHHLGSLVVAEGVEMDRQRRWLMERQCDIFQGYLFSCPIPLEEFAAYMSSQ